jgi:hypothetical protein
MDYLELQQTFSGGYSLEAGFSRSLYAKGGVCILVQEGLKFTSTDLATYCKNKDFEICAVKLRLKTRKICIIAIYGAPSGNFDIFTNK